MKHPATAVAYRLAAFAAGWGFACAAAAAPQQAPSVEHTALLMQQLRAGGYVVVVLHGATERQDRQTLSDTGRLNASGIGKLLAAETVPVGLVYASTVDSSAETAERIAVRVQSGRWRVSKLRELAPPPHARTEVLRTLAATQPAPGTNTLVVTHRANLASAFGPRFAQAGPGELAVFRPAVKTSGYELVSRVPLPVLAAYHGAVRRRSD